MPPDEPTPQRYRFAEFEFRERTGELWCGETDLHLPEQAGRLLLALLRAAGEVVTRDTLKETLWPGRTHGDFEGGINAAVRKLRQVLEDDGAEPRLIGTLPKHGYRLLVPVRCTPEGQPLPRSMESGEALGHSKRARTGIWKACAAVSALILAVSGLWLLRHESSRIAAGRTPGESLRDPLSGIEFAWIPAGTFLMGSPANEAGRGLDELQHPVTISRGIWMGTYEVTQGQYETVTGTNPARFKEVGPQAPVENVNWEDAQAFVRKLNARVTGRTYRLPTEAEWEYACRAGTMGSVYGPLGAIAWNAYTSELRTHPVGQKLPNAWGLHDMIGNVYEWCQDCYKDPYDVSLDTDPAGPPSNGFHAIRGGSWQSGTTQSRAARRSSEAEFEIRYPFTGFRVVCIPAAGP